MNFKKILPSLITAITAILVLILVNSVYTSEEFLQFTLIEITKDLSISLKIDPLGGFFASLASVLWFFTSLYATGYLAKKERQSTFFTFFLLSLAVTLGISFSANLFTFYLFYELLTLTTYPLVTFDKSKEAERAGVIYLIYSFAGAGFVLLGMFLVYSMTGTLDFHHQGILAAGSGSDFQLIATFFIFIIGFGVKAAIIPLHSWLPLAMAAPTPVSALLHAVAVVKAGIFGILRVMYSIYNVDLLQYLNVGIILSIIASFTIIIASIIAMKQDVLKRRLAYSTISQLGYITLGAGMVNFAGFSGGVIHIFNHALLKITLFFCAGIIIKMTGKKKISELKGVGKQLPLTMTAFTLASIGMIGILPLNGFISKWYLVEGSLNIGAPVFFGVLMLSSFLNACYFFPIISQAFFKEGVFEKSKNLEAPAAMLGPTLVLALACLFFGIYLDFSVPLVQTVASYFISS
ncbi:proton-conducting transporter membrane subunit [Natranaerofaba carboxydovora]|uniref:proton-conducting transporter transmembrane domain-containing protein n=1 Tax=Natranaerofaba carboxydovora TaxID=2742683 RepID=UPI001F129BDD|nr:proton-conducting transporter membrane subunit [Natranaerofaba carboxydovora]UMZ74590.1 NADH-quinone oxidoreductase subunit L [Natranaerofaba carboxydovora]